MGKFFTFLEKLFIILKHERSLSMAKNIVIYKGIIRVLYADGFSLQDGKVVPNVQREVVKEDAEFYPFMRKLINIDYNAVLPSEEEALYYMGNVVKCREGKILEAMDDGVSQKSREDFMNYMSRVSSCIYFDSGEAKPDHLMPKKELKQLLKQKKRDN